MGQKPLMQHGLRTFSTREICVEIIDFNILFHEKNFMIASSISWLWVKPFCSINRVTHLDPKLWSQRHPWGLGYLLLERPVMWLDHEHFHEIKMHTSHMDTNVSGVAKNVLKIRYSCIPKNSLSIMIVPSSSKRWLIMFFALLRIMEVKKILLLLSPFLNQRFLHFCLRRTYSCLLRARSSSNYVFSSAIVTGL